MYCFTGFSLYFKNIMHMSHTHLCEVIDESEMSLLQLGHRQRGQRVGVVQLFAVV